MNATVRKYHDIHEKKSSKVIFFTFEKKIKKMSTPIPSVLALFDQHACVRFVGDAPTVISTSYDVQGKYSVPNDSILANFTETPLTLSNLLVRVRGYDHQSASVSDIAERGASIVLAPHARAHWKQRVNSCVKLSQYLSSQEPSAESAEQSRIFFLDIGPDDEFHDASIETYLHLMDACHLVFLQNRAVSRMRSTKFGFESITRPLTDDEVQEAFTTQPSSVVTVDISPPLDISHAIPDISEVSAYFRMLFGSQKTFTSPHRVVEHTIQLPPEFKIDEPLLQYIDTSPGHIEEGSVQLDAQAQTITFIMSTRLVDLSSPMWSLTAIGKLKGSPPFTMALIPYGSLVLEKMLSHNDDMQVIVNMMRMTSNCKSTFENADIQRMWNAVINRASTAWYEARAAHDASCTAINGVPRVPISYPPPPTPAMPRKNGFSG